jgi:2-oxoglutarate dehydrogenase E1 component
MERPLVVITPKSLLRLPAATSTLDQFTSGGFQPVIDDVEISDRDRVQRIVLCSGKVYYDLNEARSRARGSSPTVREGSAVAIIRLEQFYPFPRTTLNALLASYPNATELVWAQEEPQNMGGWTFMEPRLENLLPRCERPRYVGRAASASPATGSYAIHQLEQARLIQEALTIS